MTGTTPDFSNCQNLKELLIYENNLTGTIPNFNLPKLSTLKLQNNNLTGQIPDFSLTSLRWLELQFNQLSGTIPNFNLPNLETLYLFENSLSSPVPEFIDCQNLKRLNMAVNQLTDSVPNYDLPNLEYFSVYDNNFVAPVPDFSNCPKLKVIGLAKNQFSGTVPDYYSDFPDINLVEVHVNNFTCGDIATNFAANSLINTFKYTPQNDVSCNFESDSLQLVSLYISTDGENWTNTWDLTQPMDSWSGIILNEDRRVTEIIMHNDTFITGSLPDLDFPELTSFKLHGNRLTGNIPDFSGCPKLQYLWLYENQLTGSIPNFDLEDLQEIRLHFNTLSDTIPNFELDDLRILYLGFNQLTGTIPNFNLPLVRGIIIKNNQLSGSIPNFENCLELWSLGVENNMLTGTIPDFALDFGFFTAFNNQLSGTLPSFENCPNLKFLWLNNNLLTGLIPDFSGCDNLQSLHLHENNFSGNIPDFTSERLVDLALRDNNLTGPIPDLNLYPEMRGFNASRNNLTGTIPEFNLPELVLFAVAQNSLEGEIPNFEGSSSLREVWFDDNLFTGTIPDLSNFSQLFRARFENNFFSHEDIAVNYISNKDSIGFSFSPQYYGNEQFRTDTIVSDTVFLFPSPTIPYDNPKVRWRKDSSFITNTFALHDTTYAIVDVDTTDIGVYEYWFKDETLTPIVEFRSRPINNTIEGLDLNGEPILAGELIVEFGEEMSDELIALKRDTLRNKFGGTLLKSCGCHKEIDLWRFSSAAEVDAVRSFLNGKVEQRSSDTESDGGPNRSNILTPSYINDQKLIVSNPDGGMGTDTEVVIAVIDTGVLPNHVSIQSALKVNEDEIPDNSTDDDDNGYVDDIYGVNIIDSLSMSDPNGHGTFVAGTITANIPTGHNIKVMLARAFDEMGRGELFDIICSIYYAADNGADIISMSANYKGEMSKALKHAVQYAGTQGIMFVTSAGNDTINLHQVETKYWPATLSVIDGVSNVITVTALNNEGELLEGANSSDEVVTIAAIGEGIYAPSNQHSEHYDYITGTSVSAPLVALSLGIDKSRNPDRPLSVWKDDFLNGERVESVPALLPFVKDGLKLNIEKSEVNIDSFRIKVLLEGAMLDVNGNSVLPPPMRTDLNMRGLLPGQTLIGLGTPTPAGHPYREVPFCYEGNEGNNITDYSPDIVDWVMVSIREEATTSEIYRTVGLLKDDGEVFFLRPIAAGWSDVPDSVYVVVEHRHHIGVMSSQKIPIMNTTIAYDFTTQDSYRGVGNTGFGQLQTSEGLWYMASGNGRQENDQPADINGDDKSVWVADNGVFNVYLKADYNMSGDVNGADAIIWEWHNGKSNRVETLDCDEKYKGN